jgi:transcriptional regulator with XRE-family HTH domain
MRRNGVAAEQQPDTDTGFAERMFELRKRRRLSLDQLAEASGLTKSFLSKVERKLAVPSITTAIKVSKALGVRVSQLLGEPSEQPILVVRKGEGQRFVEGSDLRNTHEALAAGRMSKRMEPFLLRPPHDYDPDIYHGNTMFSFAGEHFCYVVSGEIEIDFPDRIVRLSPGDSIYFDSSIPHRTHSSGKDVGELLVIVAPHDDPDNGLLKSPKRRLRPLEAE